MPRLLRLWLCLAGLAMLVAGVVAANPLPVRAPAPTYRAALYLPNELPASCREHAVHRRRQFALADQTNEQPVDIVFAGDSLVEGWTLLPPASRYRVLNRGISCDTTNGLHERLIRDVVAHKPKIAVVLIGVNDLYLFDREPPRDRAFRIRTNVAALALRLQGHGIRPVILSLLPTRTDLPGMTVAAANERIREINAELRRACARAGAVFLDINAPLRDDRNRLRESYSVDGLHINADAYRRLNQLLEPKLKALLASGS